MNIFLKTIGALNDETRLRILHFIDVNNEVCVCDIENSFEIIQSRVSRHLKILKEAGFLKVRRKGRWAYYSIKNPLDNFRQSILKEVSYLDMYIPQLKIKRTMNKKVLVLCTGNSCRSIMAEALINAKLDSIDAISSGVKASGMVNENAKELLKSKGLWKDKYHSKTIDTVINEDFYLVITVCDNAKESCPIFPRKVKTIHISFEDPSGKKFCEYEKTLDLIEKKLLPIIKDELY